MIIAFGSIKLMDLTAKYQLILIYKAIDAMDYLGTQI